MNALAANGSGDLSGPGKRSKFPAQRTSAPARGFRASVQAGAPTFRRAHDRVLFATPGNENEAEGVRVGFTVGKVLGGAVVRNRMKRRLREAVRLHGMIPAAWMW